MGPIRNEKSGRQPPELALLLGCARQRFTAVHQQIVEDTLRHAAVRWDDLLSIATGHGVAPLVFTNLVRCRAVKEQLPGPVARGFKSLSLRTKVVKAQRLRALADVLTACQASGAAVMLVKGAALDVAVYQQPWYTSSLDMDVVVRPPQGVNSAAIRADLNQLFWDVSRACPIECDWFAHHDITMNGVLSVCFETIWRDACALEVAGCPAFRMAAEDLLIAACINGARRRFLKLKALVDVAEIIERFDTLDWSMVAHKSRDYRCTPIVYAGLHLARQLLDCPLPADTLESLAVSAPRAALIRFLCAGVTQSLLTGAVTTRAPDRSLALPYVTLDFRQLLRNLVVVARLRGRVY